MGDQFSLLYKQQLKMRSLSAILFVGCVAAAAIQPYSWTPSKEYRYKYSAQVLSGIPELNNQFSGVRFNSEVLIQPQEDSTCLIKIENVELTSYNEEGLEITHDWTPKEKHGEREEIPSSIKSQIETPFVVFHKKGKVEMIETELGESESIINIKKALVSKLQNDISKSMERYSQQRNQVQRRTDKSPLPTFKTKESSILGECETIYSISRLPEHLRIAFEEEEKHRSIAPEKNECGGKEYYEILKSRDLNECSERPVYHRTYGMQYRTTGSGSASKPIQSSITRMILCGTLENHIIRKISTEYKVLVSSAGELKSKEMIEVSSTSTLTLLSVGTADRELSRPALPKRHSSLIYRYPQESHSLRQQNQQQQDQQQKIQQLYSQLRQAQHQKQQQQNDQQESQKQEMQKIQSQLKEAQQQLIRQLKDQLDQAKQQQKQAQEKLNQQQQQNNQQRQQDNNQHQQQNSNQQQQQNNQQQQQNNQQHQHNKQKQQQQNSQQQQQNNQQQQQKNQQQQINQQQQNNQQKQDNQQQQQNNRQQQNNQQQQSNNQQQQLIRQQQNNQNQQQFEKLAQIKQQVQQIKSQIKQAYQQQIQQLKEQIQHSQQQNNQQK